MHLKSNRAKKREQIIALIKQNKTYKEIKSEVGCCNSTISKYKKLIKKNGQAKAQTRTYVLKEQSDKWEQKYRDAIGIIKKVLYGTYNEIEYNYDQMKLEDRGTFKYAEVQIRNILEEFLEEMGEENANKKPENRTK